MTIREWLKDEGIRTTKDLQGWIDKRNQKGESRYDTLKREVGETNAFRIMRIAEVAEWDL